MTDGPGNVCYGKFWNMVDAVQQHAAHTVTTLGVPGATSNDVSGIPAAVTMAQAADTVVLVVGTDLNWAAEGHDAVQIKLLVLLCYQQLSVDQQVVCAARWNSTTLIYKIQ